MKITIFYSYEVDEETGNKFKAYYCFYHAVSQASTKGNRYIYTEVINNEYEQTCHDCEKENR